jgi:DNA-binding transcriptional ArsR family regulator
MSTTSDLVNWMKAAGEPSRLRLIALCSERDLSVTDLARAVGQSGPRVSRHLKILCEAGLLDRVRHGQWVHYRLAEGEGAARFLQSLLAQIERAESVLKRDRQRARLDRPGGSDAEVTAGSRRGRNLAAFVREQVPADRLESAWLIGTRHIELLEAASAIARTCTVFSPTQRGAQAVHRLLESRGMQCEVRATAALNALRSTTGVACVVADCLSMRAASLAPLLAGVRDALSEHGRLWLFIGYDALQESSGLENPLAQLRATLHAARFICERMSPIEADGEHLLAVYATPMSVAARALSPPSAREAS